MNQLIENYKGVHIFHDAAKDIFFTQLARRSTAKKLDDFVSAPRLQKMRDEIDMFLTASTKKPVVPEIIFIDKYEEKKTAKVILMNLVSYQLLIEVEGNQKTIKWDVYKNSFEGVYLKTKENQSNITAFEEAQEQVKQWSDIAYQHKKNLLKLELAHFKPQE